MKTNSSTSVSERRTRPIPMIIKCMVGSLSLFGLVVCTISSLSRKERVGSLFVLPIKFPTDHFFFPTTAAATTAQRRKLLDLQHQDVSNYDRTVPFPLFDVSTYTVMGPSHFPKPTRIAAVQGGDETKKKNVQPILKPTYGSHRPDVDAIFIFATEYPLHNYMCFLETLRQTGYDGDVVMAVSIQDVDPQRNANTFDYLTNEPHTVIYVVELSCFNAEGEAVSSAKGGMRVCQIHNLFGQVDDDEGKEQKLQPLPDPRPPRTLQTTRYELYWIWSLQYNLNSWIMLVDARDSFFQTNPFQHVPRDDMEETKKTQGILHFFGENTEATRIGLSKKNKQWITTAYGNVVSAALEDKPTICSGSTMGEQIAIETYLRAMVAESDESGVVLVGADQGFHNFLYYSNKLANAATISKIVVFAQGEGAINNLGAMRTKELNEWGNGKLLGDKEEEEDNGMTVYNWDGSPSPVVHQFDRHKQLSNYMYKRKASEFQQKWRQEKQERANTDKK